MTRKRYIKLTMAQGYQRNQAQDLARDGPRLGIPYRALYTARRCRYPVLLSSKQFDNAMRQIVKVTAQLAAGLKEAAARRQPMLQAAREAAARK